MSRVLMYKDPTSFNLFSVELDHKLHVPDAFGHLIGLALAIGYESLKLAEGHTGWASYEDQRLLLVDILLGPLSMLRDVEIPTSSEVHGVPHVHAELGGFLANSWR